MRRNRHIWSAFFALAGLVSTSGMASAKDVRIANGAGYTVEQNDGSTILRIRTQSGVNIDTRTLARAIGTTPYAIRAENPTSTLALCKVGTHFVMSRGIWTAEGRRTNAVWTRCAEKDQYVYILPSSTLTVSGRAHRGFNESQQLLVQIEQCKSARCANEVAKKLALNVSTWPAPAADASTPSPRIGVTTVSRPVQTTLSAPSARSVSFATLIPVIRGIGLYIMGSLAGLLTLFCIGFTWAMRRLRHALTATRRAEREIVNLRVERDRCLVENRRLEMEREYYKKARQYMVEHINASSRVSVSSGMKADDALLREREDMRRAHQAERKRADKLEAEFRSLVRSIRTACGEESAPVYIERMPTAIIGAGAIELVHAKLGTPVLTPAPALEEKPGHLTQRLYTIVQPAPTALPQAKEDSGIRRKATADHVPSSARTEHDSIVGREYQSGFPSVVKTERNMPVVCLPLVYASEPPIEYEVDNTAPYPWPGSTMIGLHDNRRIPKSPGRKTTEAA